MVKLNKPPNLNYAIGALKSLLGKLHSDEEFNQFIDACDEVINRYQVLFSENGISQIEAEDFREFLMFRNNRHWSGLQRMGPQTTRDMQALRIALQQLIDESIPIDERINLLIPSGKARVHKLGKAILTPILLITNPQKYGVWNGTSEGALRKLDIWPDFDRDHSIGERYLQVNDLLLELTRELKIDLWTLDALWYAFLKTDDQLESPDEVSVDEEAEFHFGLERHLHDFLLDNWEHTELGKEWNLVEEGGDIKGYGYERITDVGKIDLLAKHKTELKWLVIELKRGQTSDDTVGQITRYMGWVKRNLAEDLDKIEGLIIGLSDDKKLRHSLYIIPNVWFMQYKLEFSLIQGKK